MGIPLFRVEDWSLEYLPQFLKDWSIEYLPLFLYSIEI